MNIMPIINTFVSILTWPTETYWYLWSGGLVLSGISSSVFQRVRYSVRYLWWGKSSF